MSWLKFNDSLNAIKGQISNFAQEVLAEDPSTSEETTDDVLSSAKKEIDDLQNLCTTQNNEISVLRRQIAELQQKITEPSTSTKTESNVVSSNLEDSWFWESENNTPSTSSKTDAEIISKSTSGGDLTIIPLDHGLSENEIIENLKQKLRHLDEKYEKKNLENAVLNEKLTQIQNENKELNENIEELDKQHNQAIEEILCVKNDLQNNLSLLQKNYNDLQLECTEINKKYENLKLNFENIDKECKELKLSNENVTEEIRSYKNLNEKLKNELEFKIQQNNDLGTILSEKEDLIKRLEDLKNENTAKEENVEDIKNLNLNLQKELEELKGKLKTYHNLQNEIDELKISFSNVSEKLNESELNYRQLLLEKETESEEFKNLLEKSEKNEKSLQNQLIDLQSIINNQSTMQINSTSTPSSGILLAELKTTIKRYTDFESSSIDNELNYLEEFLKSIRDSNSKISALEKKLISLSEEKDRISHEKSTIQADLLHYEIECAELMKNNEILLNELDTIKSNKLETISENNEDSIVLLEKRLEQYTELNNSLEKDYKDIQEKLELNLKEKLQLTTNLNELENKLELKNNEFKELQNCITDLKEENNHLLYEINELKAEYNTPNDEIQGYKSEIDNLKSNIISINEKNSNLVEKLKKELEDSNDELVKLKDELSINTIKLNELNQQIINKEEIITKLEITIKEKDENLERLLEKDDTLNKLNIENQSIKESLEHIIREKNDLINLVTVKHNESLQYHAEIQRLSQLLQTTNEEYEKLKSTHFPDDEREKMMDQINFLREKSDIMTKNLLAEQTNQKLMLQEKQEIIEQKENLVRELERLRVHLIEKEDQHTQEIVDLRNTIEENKVKVIQLESEAKKTSTAYTSASIRANQQTETLQAQYMILQQQRDDIAAKLSLAEDRESKNQAALINLQCALEQFQRDKERDVEAQSQRLTTELKNEKLKQTELRNEIQNLQTQLSEAKNGLLAASRISDQLEMSQITITTLKNELMKSQDKCIAFQTKLHDAETNQADKVEKCLIKNLLIGYVVCSNNSDKQQILKLISSVLDFNQNETEKVGLNRTHTDWLNSIVSGGSNNNNSGNYNKESLAQAFVKFLEKESQPRVKPKEMPTLLNIHPYPQRRPSQIDNQTSSVTTIPEQNESTTPSTSSSSSTVQQNIAVQPVLLHDHVLPSFAPTRNSSSILKEILHDS